MQTLHRIGRRALLALSLGLPLALTGGCSSTKASTLPSGRGLVSYDRTAPAGAERFPRPDWKEGDLFEYRRGERVRMRLRVERHADGGLLLVDEERRTALALDEDLGELGELAEDRETYRVRFDPIDACFSWPLWSGKRWATHFVRRTEAGEEIPFLVEYRCDGIETIEVPAGRLRCLRIWRTVSIAAEGDFVERAALLWYSPEVGYLARRLENSLVVDLVDYQRQ